MFADVDADIYVLVDGDATYDAPSARAMIARLVDDRLDMVVAARVEQEQAAYRRGHRTGNRLLTGFFASVFGATFTDILSGYRVFSRRFVKSFPVLSRGFEIETELTVHALELELAVAEIPTPYYARPEGSVSKLSTWRDGLRILSTIFDLYRSERPLAFFSGLGIALAIVSIGLAIPIFVTYFEQGIVPRIPTAILSTGLMLLAFLSMVAGLVLDTVTQGQARDEAARLSGAAGAGRGLGPARKAAEGDDEPLRELVRTNDAVLVSAIEALLDGAEIPHVVLDQNMSVLEGSLGILPRRMLVDEDHVGCRAPAARRGRARARASSRCPRMIVPATSPRTPCSAAGCGCSQPKRGHRVGHDAILLAAACPARAGERAVDLGAGVGAAGLALAARVAGTTVTLVEIDAGARGAGGGERAAQRACRAGAMPRPRRRRAGARLRGGRARARNRSRAC